jgi:hypothetical protein
VRSREGREDRRRAVRAGARHSRYGLAGHLGSARSWIQGHLRDQRVGLVTRDEPGAEEQSHWSAVGEGVVLPDELRRFQEELDRLPEVVAAELEG